MVSGFAHAACFTDVARGAKELLVHGNQFPPEGGPVGFCCVPVWLAKVTGTGVDRAF